MAVNDNPDLFGTPKVTNIDPVEGAGGSPREASDTPKVTDVTNSVWNN